MKGYLRLGLTLLIVCVVAAALLGYANSLTAPVIAENTKIESYAKYYEVLGAGPETYDIEEASEEELGEVTSKYKNVTGVLKVTEGETPFAYVFTVRSSGYGGEVDDSILFDVDGNILGYRNISNSESPGFGQKITEEPFYGQFTGKSVANSSSLVLGSGGGENEIEAISGATITSKAVLSGLNDAVGALKEFYTAK